MSVTIEARKMRRSALPWILGLLMALLAIALAWRGASFYALSLDARVEHDDYRVLGPSGLVGHGYGIVGTGLILLNLLYLVRRLLAKLPLGPMKAWLDLHVFTGLSGGMLILFHSAFQLRTPITAISAVSLIIVIATGILGRWLYALAPGVDDGELAEQLRGLDVLAPGSGERVRGALASLPPSRLEDPTFLRAVAHLPRALGRAGARRRAARSAIREATAARELDRHERQLLRRIERRTVKLAGRAATAAGASALLRTWRGLHRLLAILMLLTVPVHIGVAWLYGYRWIWSE